MAARFEERIESYVEQQLENAFSGGQPQIPTKLALGGLGIAFASILMMVARRRRDRAAREDRSSSAMS